VPKYEFTTIWRLEAPIEQVYAMIERTTDWPRWWPSVREVREVSPGGEDGIGAIHAFTFRGRLPYLLRFDLRTTRRQPPHALEGAATGELEGVGAWALSEALGRTTARYDWRIRTTRWWMNLFAPLPFVDAIFRLNHHAVMRDGLAGIRRELGVKGEYERIA
jgi:Polyketide cyclase / dehydrase and lipid transport